MKKATISIFLGIASFLAAEKPAAPVVVKDDCPVQMVERVMPSIVFVAKKNSPFEKYHGDNPSAFFNFFRNFYEYMWPTTYGHGSGFVISQDGHIVTNAHVVEGATQIEVAMRHPMLRVVKAKLIGSDFRTDIAVLKIETHSGKSYPYLKFSNSNKLKPGMNVMLIGTPITNLLESTVTSGIVSSIERSHTHIDAIDGFIQTDVAANPGNSGGPLLNMKGEVVGVISRLMTHANGLAFAIPSNKARKVVNQLIEKEFVDQGFLGVMIQKRTENAFSVYHFEHNDGALIEAVIKGSPAYNIGLQKGDLIVEVDGEAVTTSRSLTHLVCAHAPGTTLTLKVLRGKEEITSRVTLMKMDKAVICLILAQRGELKLIL